jgi:hypothetical protein
MTRPRVYRQIDTASGKTARAAPQPSSAKPGSALRVNPAGDSFEQEADRAAAAVSAGSRIAEWSLSKVNMGSSNSHGETPGTEASGSAGQRHVQRQFIQRQVGPTVSVPPSLPLGPTIDPTTVPTPGTAPAPNNYGAAAAKLAEAFAKTEYGKKLIDALLNEPLVKDAESFLSTLPGKIVAGSAAAGVISGLAAAHKGLPAQLPAIPLDPISPKLAGVKVKIEVQGPLDHPTGGMITFSYTPGEKKKKPKSRAELQREENARLRDENDKFNAGVTYKPGSPQDIEKKQADKAVEDYTLGRFGSLPGTGGRPLVPGGAGAGTGAAGAGSAASPDVSLDFSYKSPYQPPPFSLLDKKLELKPFTGSTPAPPSTATPAPASNDAAKKDDTPVQRKPADLSAQADLDTSTVPGALASGGRPLDRDTRGYMESRFGFDFSRVRLHTDSAAEASARALRASAYTVGSDVVFAAGQFAPQTAQGKKLLAHELTHVVQQDAHIAQQHSNLAQQPDTQPTLPAALDPHPHHEAEADRIADSINRVPSRPGASAGSRLRPGGTRAIAFRAIQRKIAMRDVGRGEQSGFARIPELVTRLNAMSSGLTFAVTGGELTYHVKPGGTLNGFDTQMQAFIDQNPVIPLRFTNRHGLLGDRVHGFNDRVLEDAWSSGYVDIDDLLASSDLGLQSVLVHFLRERSATPNYARRIGSESLNTDHPAAQTEFNHAHAQGIEAERNLLRSFFGDPGINVVPGAESGNIFRVYINSRKDHIRTRVTPRHGAQEGVDAVSVEVVTKDGKVHTPEKYKLLLIAAAAGGAGAATGAAAAGAAAGTRAAAGAVPPLAGHPP